VLARYKPTRTSDFGRGGVGASAGYDLDEKKWSFSDPGQVEEHAGFIILSHFSVNSSSLKKEHREFLDKLLKSTKLDQPTSLFPIREITGFTDAVNRARGNEELREWRAESVHDDLEFIGVHPSNNGVPAAARADKFLSDNETREGRARNRAVVLRYDAFLPPDPPPPKPKPRAEPHTNWAMGFIGNLAPPAEPGISLTIALFRVREVPRGEKFMVAMIGGGPGLSVDLSVLLKDATFIAKILKFIAGAIAGGSIGIDDIQGKEEPFKTRSEAHKRDFFGMGLIMHAGGAHLGTTQVGFPPHTIPEGIPAPTSISLGASAGAEACICLPF
jgi:outer membrane protein OmpA-like peptidoglycan-associated protein